MAHRINHYSTALHESFARLHNLILTYKPYIHFPFVRKKNELFTFLYSGPHNKTWELRITFGRKKTSLTTTKPILHTWDGREGGRKGDFGNNNNNNPDSKYFIQRCFTYLTFHTFRFTNTRRRKGSHLDCFYLIFLFSHYSSCVYYKAHIASFYSTSTSSSSPSPQSLLMHVAFFQQVKQ